MRYVGAERKWSELAGERDFFEYEVIVLVLLIFEVDGNEMVQLRGEFGDFVRGDDFFAEIAFGFGGFSIEGFRGLDSHMI